MLENLVFLALRRRFKNIFYFSGNGECDFLIKYKNRMIMAAQVCYNLNEDNKGREISGLVEALNATGLDEGIIITYDQEDKLEIEGKTISVVPAWKWISK